MSSPSDDREHSKMNRLPPEILRRIFEMDSTFHLVYRQCVREISLLQTRHVMHAFCQTFFKKKWVPCQLSPFVFKLYFQPKRKPYVITYLPFVFADHYNCFVECRRMDTETGTFENIVFPYLHEIGFGLLKKK